MPSIMVVIILIRSGEMISYPVASIFDTGKYFFQAPSAFLSIYFPGITVAFSLKLRNKAMFNLVQGSLLYFISIKVETIITCFCCSL